jgi:hypothetical protein
LNIKQSSGRLDTKNGAAILKKEAYSPLKEACGNDKITKNNMQNCETKENCAIEVIFVCLKFGTKYSAEYVNNLYLALVKNTADYYGEKKGDTDRDGNGIGARGRFRFVCYTENADGLCAGVEVHPLPVEPLEKAPSSAGSAANTITPHTPPSTAHTSTVTGEERHRRVLIEGLKGWMGWWYKAYLFHAVESLCSPDEDMHTPSLYNRVRADSRDYRKEEGIGIGTGAEVREEKPSAKRLICYFDLDTVFGGSLDFLFRLLVTETETHTETETEAKAEVKFFTLGASHFPCEGRPCGINSSVMIWQPGGYGCSDRGRDRRDRGSNGGRGSASDRSSEEGQATELCCSINSIHDSSSGSSRDSCSGTELGDGDAVHDGDIAGDRDRGRDSGVAGWGSIDAFFDAETGGSFCFENIFFYLFEHYEAVTKCVYKFDHYLEILLFSSPHTASTLEHHPSLPSAYSSQRTTRAVRVVYLQDIPGFKGKIIDFSSLFTGVSHVEDVKRKNSENTCSCGEAEGHDALYSSCLTATPPPTLVCDSALPPPGPSPNMTCTSTLSRPSACEPSNTEKDRKRDLDLDMDMNIDMEMLRGARVICFPLIPKPHQAAQSSRLVKLMWSGQAG